MNSKSKNLIIAALVTAIYYTNIVKGIPTEKVVIAIVCIFVGAVAIMELYDGIDMLRYGTKSFLTKFRFRMYKQKVEAKVEKERAKGRNELWMKEFIVNWIMHDKRFAFSGAQVGELISLAKADGLAECKKCGHEGIRKDMLKTIDGYICEDCLKE